ncbi:MAG: hypothetical protein ABIK76_00955 [candidate division WOR-3 bacterium]
MGYKKFLTLVILFFNSVVLAGDLDLVSEDSLYRLPINMRYCYWQLEKDYQPFMLDSHNVKMVGKWGRGWSRKVTGKDNLVFLSLGSEVAIIDISNPSQPRVVYEVQAKGLVCKAVVKNSFLFIGGPGIEIWILLISIKLFPFLFGHFQRMLRLKRTYLMLADLGCKYLIFLTQIIRYR